VVGNEKGLSSRTHWVGVWYEGGKEKAYKGWVKEFDWLIWTKRSIMGFGVWLVHGINSILLQEVLLTIFLQA
jgi:hypothetical protein